MKLATLKNGTRDGELVIVSRDLSRAVSANGIATTMIDAIERWAEVEQPLAARYAELNSEKITDSARFSPINAMSPLPRTYQFVDASAFLNHGDIMKKAYDLDVKTEPGIPILIQRQSDDFLGPCDDYPYPIETDNGDFEGEFAVVVDDTPAGISSESALRHIKLVMILNDMSMRTHLFRELRMGFGLIQAKPATVFGPVAVTPDELGHDWRDGLVLLDMNVHRNGEWFGNPNGSQMDFSFGQLISHLAYNRNLRAGTIIGSGTVSNRNYSKVGSACLAERRAIETIESGNAKTPFLKFGDLLRFEVFGRDGQSIFGAINHRMEKRNLVCGVLK